MPRKWLLAGLIIALAAVAIPWLLLQRPKTQAIPAPAPAVPKAEPSPAPIVEITLAGQVEAANVVNVTSPVEGTIEQLVADVGDTVIQGRILARVQNPKAVSAETMAQMELERRSNRIAQIESALIAARLEVSRSEADVARIRLEFERSEKEYQRQQFMFREGITPRVVYEKSQQDYNALKADSDRLAEAAKNSVNRVGDLTRDLESARHDLDQQKAVLEQAHTTSSAGDVPSPAEGIVVARCCQVGASVTTTTTLFQITSDLTALQVTASADAAMVQRVHAGQPAVIAVEGVPEAISAKVRDVNGGQVIVDFTSPSAAVRPGMMAQVKIKVS